MKKILPPPLLKADSANGLMRFFLKLVEKTFRADLILRCQNPSHEYAAECQQQCEDQGERCHLIHLKNRRSRPEVEVGEPLARERPSRPCDLVLFGRDSG